MRYFGPIGLVRCEPLGATSDLMVFAAVERGLFDRYNLSSTVASHPNGPRHYDRSPPPSCEFPCQCEVGDFISRRFELCRIPDISAIEGD